MFLHLGLFEKKSKFTVLHIFLETAIDTAISINRLLEVALDPATSRNLFVDMAGSKAASKDRAFVEAAKNVSHFCKCISRGNSFRKPF